MGDFSPGLKWGGLATIILGGGAVVAGVAVALSCGVSSGCSNTQEERQDIAEGLAGAGVGFAVLGTVMFVVGNIDVKQEHTTTALPELTVGPGSGSLTWRW
jgi:hypothetical protein